MSASDNDLAKIWALFTTTKKRKAGWMLLLVVLMARAETLGIVSIMPFLSVLGRPAIIQEHPVLQAIYETLDFQSSHGLIFALGLLSIFVVLASSAFKTVTQHVLNRFAHLQRHVLSSRLLSRYLHQPYEFFLARTPSVLAKNVLSEADVVMGNLIQPFSEVIVQGIVVLVMLTLVFAYNPLTALVIVAVVGSLYGLIYLLVRRCLKRTYTEMLEANRQRYQTCNEALQGIHDIEIIHSEAACITPFAQRPADTRRQPNRRNMVTSVPASCNSCS